jgi:hypothetical protein
MPGLEPDVGAQEFVEDPEFEGDVLETVMSDPLRIIGEAGHLDNRHSVVGLVIAKPCRLQRRAACVSCRVF